MPAEIPENVDLYIERFEKLCQKINIDPALKEKIFNANFKWAKDLVGKTLITMVNNKSKELKAYHEFLYAVFPATLVESITKRTRPLIVLTPDKLDHLRVYHNVIFDPVNLEKTENIKITDVDSVFGMFLHSYQEDMSGKIPHADEKWKDQTRIDKRLYAYEDMPTARAFVRFYNLEEMIKPDQIRDLATKFDNARKPMQLLYADRPEDFLIMYGSGPSSCMMHSTYKDTWVILDKAGLTPTSFYAYFPWTRGAYIMKGGKVAARTILFANPETPPFDMGFPSFKKEAKSWNYGRIYAINTEMHSEFLKALKSNGYSKIEHFYSNDTGGKFIPPEGVEFRIPGVKGGSKNYIIPFPYFDNMDYHGKGFYARFDTKTNEFVMSYQTANRAGVVPITSRGGYLKSSDYIEKTCEHCKANTTTYGWIASQDGCLFCGEKCVTQAGYTKMLSGNVEPIWQKVENKEDYYQTEDGVLFTNLRAANNHGFYQSMIEMGVFAEELGAPLVNNGTYRFRSKEGDQFLSKLRGEEATYVNPVFPIGEIKLQRTVTFNLDDEPLVAA